MNASLRSEPALADAIDEALPQTQCGKCGYQGCRPYALAVASGAADINRCPPGGERVVWAIAALVGVAYKPLDPACGTPTPPAVALIDERRCIGCTLCIQACPVDAIVGAAKLMHTVIAQSCTGCELCLPPCPVDCISLQPTGEAEPAIAAARARSRYQARNLRLERNRRERAETLATDRAASAERRKRLTIARALERARVRLQNRQT